MYKWEDFNKFDEADELYLPTMGEGETLATQIVTAVTKLVYKWFNDGDIYDNSTNPFRVSGNDLSSYANWLDQHTEYGDILKRIGGCNTDDEYTTLLYDLCEASCDLEKLAEQNKKPKEGSIYKCEGVFQIVEYPEDDEEWEDDYWDDEEDEDWDD